MPPPPCRWGCSAGGDKEGWRGGHQLGGGAVALPCNPPGNARNRAGVWGTSEPPRLRAPEWGHPSLGAAASPWGPSPVSEQGGVGGVTPPALARVRGVPGVCVRVLLAAHPLCWAPGCGGHRGGCPWAGFGLVSRGQDPRDGKWGQAAGGWARPGAAPSVPWAGCREGPQTGSGRCPVPAQPGGEVSWKVPGERPWGWRALPGTQPFPLAVRWVPRRCPLLAPGGSPCCRPGSGGPAASRLTQDPLPTPQPDTGRAPGVTAALLELARTPQTLFVSLGAGTGPLEGSPQLPRYPLAPGGQLGCAGCAWQQDLAPWPPQPRVPGGESGGSSVSGGFWGGR